MLIFPFSSSLFSKSLILQVIRLTVLVTDTTAPVLQQGRGLLIITIIDINEQPPVCLPSFFFSSMFKLHFRLLHFHSIFSTSFVVFCRTRFLLVFVRVNLAIKMKSVLSTGLGSIALLFAIDKDSFFFLFQFPFPSSKEGKVN